MYFRQTATYGSCAGWDMYYKDTAVDTEACAKITHINQRYENQISVRHIAGLMILLNWSHTSSIG